MNSTLPFYQIFIPLHFICEEKYLLHRGPKGSQKYKMTNLMISKIISKCDLFKNVKPKLFIFDYFPKKFLQK